MKTGIVDVGGGLRGVYAAGIFDYCLDMGIQFDFCIGVSAGSANVTSYMAGQRKRNYLFYTEYPFRKEYMSIRNFLFKGTYIDMDYLYGTLSNSAGENPLDYMALKKNSAELLVVATNAQTGKAVYFNKDDLRKDDYGILKESSSIPFVCKPYEIDGVFYYDGAIGDPVPVEKAFQCGCDKVVVILSKPRNMIRTAQKDKLLAGGIQKKYPFAAEQLKKRAEHYNQDVQRSKEYEAKGNVLIVAPDDTCGVATLTKNQEALRQLYEKGYRDAQAIPDFLKTYKKNR